MRILKNLYKYTSIKIINDSNQYYTSLTAGRIMLNLLIISENRLDIIFEQMGLYVLNLNINSNYKDDILEYFSNDLMFESDNKDYKKIYNEYIIKNWQSTYEVTLELFKIIYPTANIKYYYKLSKCDKSILTGLIDSVKLHLLCAFGYLNVPII
jgi:hypothetical protein